MHGQLKAPTPAEYMAQVEEPRKSEIAAFDRPVRKPAPEPEPFVHSGMPAYGRWHYKHASGREGDGFRIGVAGNEYIPKTKIGKSCVRFKRLSDVNQATLEEMIREGARAASRA